MAKPNPGKTETLNLRVSPEFKKKLVEEAAKTRRSVTNYLEVALLDVWECEVQERGAGKKRGR